MISDKNLEIILSQIQYAKGMEWEASYFYDKNSPDTAYCNGKVEAYKHIIDLLNWAKQKTTIEEKTKSLSCVDVAKDNPKCNDTERCLDCPAIKLYQKV